MSFRTEIMNRIVCENCGHYWASHKHDARAPTRCTLRSCRCSSWRTDEHLAPDPRTMGVDALLADRRWR